MQEAATKLSQNDIRTRIECALHDAREAMEAVKGEYCYCYVIDIFGDDQSGDVVFSCSGDIMRAPYTCSATGAAVDISQAIDVVPMTTYEVEGAEALTEAGRRNSSRDLKQIQSIHDYSVGLGALCATKESASASTGTLKLTESTAFPTEIVLSEAFTPNKKIMLISPGKGSSAYYEEEMLRRDGPAIFKAGLPMRIDHPSEAQEADRPEGSVRDWAAVLATDAVWMESGPAGKGLYGEIKPFSDAAEFLSERAPYAGVSIAAWGEVKKENGKVVMREGVPVLTKLTAAEGVDMVTRAGRGGMFLSEAARAADSNPGGSEMDEAAVKKLQETIDAQSALNRRLLERALRGDAREQAVKILKGINLLEAAKEQVIDSVMAGPLPQTEAGDLDVAKFTEAVNDAAKRTGAFVAAIMGGGRVLGMGAPAPLVAADPQAEEKRIAEAARERETFERAMGDIMGNPTAAKAAATYKEVA